MSGDGRGANDDVEFLPEPGGDGADPARPDPGTPVRRRARWLLAVAALTIAATVWVLTRPSDRPAPKHVAAPTALPAPTTTSSSADPCRGAPFCTVSVIIPRQLRAAIQRYLPDLRRIQVHSYVAQSLTTGGSYLTARDIDAQTPTATVLIALHRRLGTESGPTSIAAVPLGLGSALVHRSTDAYDIDLQYIAAETVAPSLPSLRRLATDPRLETP